MSHRLLSVVHGPVYGGAHNQIVKLYEPLLTRGIETIALIPDEPGNARARLEEAGVETVELPLGRLRATRHPATQLRFVARLPRDVAAIRRVIRERDIDVVQVHGPTNPQAAIAGRMEGVAVVWQLYDTRAPMALRRLAMPLVVRLADVIMSTGLGVARAHPGALGFRERLVPFVPPVDPAETRPDPERRAAARAELGIADGEVAVGTVGNLNPSKGHEYLVRAARIVRSRHPRAVLRILGADSPAHAEYQARVRREAEDLGDAVRFSDPGARVAELLPGLDVFALASVPRSEGIPTVILEAMACALPVVTTEVGAVREVVIHGEHGSVVPPEDPAALADAIGAYVADHELRATTGAENRRALEAEYGLERCADTHLRAYRTAIAHRTTRRGSVKPAEAR